MEFRFAHRQLEDLYVDGKGYHQWPPEVLKAFSRVMSQIVAATDERYFYLLKGLHYEKLSGDRASKRSLRLNRQWRLIVTLERDSEEEGGSSYLLIHARELQKSEGEKD